MHSADKLLCAGGALIQPSRPLVETSGLPNAAGVTQRAVVSCGVS